MKPISIATGVDVYHGDALTVLRTLPSESVHCVVTSPPYWGLRDYGTAVWVGGLVGCDHRSPTMREGRNEDRAKLAGSEATNAAQLLLAARTGCGKCGAQRVDSQLGLEATPEEYVAKMVEVFRELRGVLREDGTLWLNMGDSYCGNRGNTDEKPGLDNKNPKANLAIGHDKRYSRNVAASTLQGGKMTQYNAERAHERGFSPDMKPKDLCGIPWMLAFALRADGWYLRQDIIWHKPNPMPESVTDRCTKSHEYIFLLSKSERYYFDQEAILEPCSLSTHARLSQDVQSQIGSERVPGKTNGNMKAVSRRPKAWDKDMGSNRTLVGGYGRKLAEPGSGTKNNDSFDAAMAIMPENRNKRSVWTVNTQSFSEAHFATFPEELIKPCILAGCPPGGTVLDPFFGSGTTALVARQNGCKCIGIELNRDYIDISARRLSQEHFSFTEATL